MRTTLTLIFSCFIAFSTFAQKTNTIKTDKPAKKPLIGYTQITAGVSMPTIMGANSNVLSARNTAGWTAGIVRNKVLGNHLDVAYGVNVLKVRQQAFFTESTIAYTDNGLRNYNSFYVRFPVEVKYNLKEKGPFYVNGGLTTNYMLLNSSMESFTRAHIMDDDGHRFDKPINEEKLQFRNISGFDVAVRVGAGMNIKFDKQIITASVAYNQGLLTKDMGFKTGSLEFALSMTLPQFTGFGKTPKPVSWLD